MPEAASRLRDLFGDEAVDGMVEQQPLLLTEDVDAIVDKLQRYGSVCLGIVLKHTHHHGHGQRSTVNGPPTDRLQALWLVTCTAGQ